MTGARRGAETSECTAGSQGSLFTEGDAAAFSRVPQKGLGDAELPEAVGGSDQQEDQEDEEWRQLREMDAASRT